MSGDEESPPTWRSLAVALAAGAVVVALAVVVSVAMGTARPLWWTCAVIVVVTALLPFVTVGTPFASRAARDSHVLNGKAGRDYFERATEGRVALLLHPLAFALPAIGTLLLMWAA